MQADPELIESMPEPDARVGEAFERDARSIEQQLRRKYPKWDRHGIDDAIQDAFIRILERLRARETIFNIGAYAKRIAINWLHDRHAAAQRYDDCGRVSEGARSFLSAEGLIDDDLDALSTQEREYFFRKGFESLTPRQQRILLLRADGRIFEEISELLGISKSTAADDASKALTILREWINGRA